MRSMVVIALVGACGFRGAAPDASALEPSLAIDEAVSLDDARAFSKQCPDDPALLVCLRFDQDPLPAALPNEGAIVPLVVQAANLTSVPSDQQRAAELGPTSTLFLPGPVAAATSIATIELWLRLDAQPADDARMTLADSSDGLAFFYFRDHAPPEIDAGTPRTYLRSVIGETLYGPNAPLALGTWHHLGAVCDAGTHILYVDGVEVTRSSSPACTPQTITANGFAIAIDNRIGIPMGDPWVGAIDGLRLWSVARTPAQMADPRWTN